MRWVPLLVLCASCSRPPETPEGLDQSLRHLFQAFYGPDDGVSAGLSGMVQWYESEGRELLGTSADIDNIGAFELGELGEAEVGAFSPRPSGDPRAASGVIAVAELPCQWHQAEELLIRPDQDVVFTDFDFYERTYVSSRQDYDSAREQDLFPLVTSEIVPDDAESAPGALLRTENSTSGTELGVTIPFQLRMHARHGEFDVLGEPARAGLYAVWMPERAEASGGVNTMEQTYSLEVDLERGGQTLWVYASWAELHTSVYDSDSTVMMAISANKARGTGERMAAICEGEVVLD